MDFFDTHAHYNDEKFEEDRDIIIKQVQENNIKYITVVGYNIESSIKAIKIANKYDNIYATVGISPNDLKSEINLEKIENLAQNKKVVAIGEIGLDYYWNKENKDLQRDIFLKQIEIANKLELPISIHTREAVYDTLDILKNKIKVKNNGIFHCCPLNVELIKEAIKLGFYISFSGNVTFKNSKNADKCIETVPKEKLLIETDSPYMTPEPHRGKRNNSIYVKLVAQKIADVKNMSLEDVAKITLENAKRIYKIGD